MAAVTDSLEQLQSQNLKKLNELQDKAAQLLEEVNQDTQASKPAITAFSWPMWILASPAPLGIIVLLGAALGLVAGYLIWGLP